jgi:hypothetical protein
MNTMIDCGEYPDIWKSAEVKPLPKTKQPSKYKDYRPISLLFHLGKLAEQIMINEMWGKLQETIELTQYAYQEKVGTIDAILQLVDDITADLDKLQTKYIQLAPLDFSKAFDWLQPSIVLQKMNNHNFHPQITRLIADFLK